MVMPLLKQLELRKNVTEYAPVFKVHAPYDEADHIFNIALNLVAGGTCLDHLEIRRTDEAFLDAIGAVRIPDPTTAGNFCRRFDASKILDLMKGINQSRMIAWRQQPDDFFDQATIEADGTMVGTEGQKKGNRSRHSALNEYLTLNLSLNPGDQRASKIEQIHNSCRVRRISECVDFRVLARYRVRDFFRHDLLRPIM